MNKLPEKMKELLRLLQETNEEEIDCDSFWEKAAELAERDLTLNLDEMKIYLHHLKLCPGCAEEFALLKSMATESEID